MALRSLRKTRSRFGNKGIQMGGEVNKAVVALVMAVLVVIDQAWGISLGPISEEWVTVLLAILTPVLVWLIPNHPAEHPLAR